MADPSIERFRRVVSAAAAHLEERRKEVNDLNVFPVADGDTGDNMALTLRAVSDELDRLDGQMVDEIGRTELVNALARAALMGARGNSGVILSQIVRGAAEELASRPGELVDPVLVAAAFARAADAAYESVREPAEGTMLTVFREMAHSISRRLAHMEEVRPSPDATPAEQDALLAELLEDAVRDGEQAVARTPEQLEVLRESGVVDAGAHGLVVILAGVVAGLRGDIEASPEVPHYAPAADTRPHHEDSRYRYCTNFIVTGVGPRQPRVRPDAGGARRLGAGRRRRGHAQGPRPHRRAGGGRGALRRAGEVDQLDVADMREQIAERTARLQAGRCAAVAVVAGRGMRELYEGLGRLRGRRRGDVQPLDLRPARRDPRGPRRGGPRLPEQPNVVMAAERAAELSDKQARVVTCTSQQAGLAALVELDPASSIAENADRLDAALDGISAGSVAPAARDDAKGRFVTRRRRRLRRRRDRRLGRRRLDPAETMARLAEGAEILTVIGGEVPRSRSRSSRATRRRASSSSSTMAASRTTGGCWRRSER